MLLTQQPVTGRLDDRGLAKGEQSWPLLLQQALDPARRSWVKHPVCFMLLNSAVKHAQPGGGRPAQVPICTTASAHSKIKLGKRAGEHNTQDMSTRGNNSKCETASCHAYHLAALTPASNDKSMRKKIAALKQGVRYLHALSTKLTKCSACSYGAPK